MNAERSGQVKRLFTCALEREGDEGAAYLHAACAGDAALLAELESLLDADAATATFIERPAAEVAARLFAEHDRASAVNRRIGHYEIDRELGRGGMGAVYLARRADDAFSKQVAIKLIKRGMDTDYVLRRFRIERQILADLDHPNIARLFDGGTTDDGLPYFVMEYIDGVSVDRYADEHKLSIRARLQLFRALCAGVQFAHQNLVIHRDLKPSNILVTADGTPKLLDFGIAKLLDPAAETTQTMIAAMTPEYASPEQMRGENVTTASDVYSLGVILYELLTGRHPYTLAGRTPEEMRRVVGEHEPERPSLAVTRDGGSPATSETTGTNRADENRTTTPARISAARGESTPDALRRRLRGDLDNIVLTAMRKEPERRYASVAQFSEDIRRHLDGLPVGAHRATFGYRAEKFIRRNKAAVFAGVVVLVTLVGGMAATLWQAQVARSERARAEEQRARAEQRFADVRELANSFLFEFHDAIRDLEGATAARKLVVERALKYLDSLARDAGDDPGLQRELASAYMKVGAVQGEVYGSNTGDSAGALRSYQKAAAILEALYERDERTKAEVRRDLSETYGNIGALQTRLSDADEAAATQSKALALDEEIVAADPANADARYDLATKHIGYGDAMVARGDMLAAIDSYRKALALRQGLHASDPTSVKYDFGVVVPHQRMGNALSHVAVVSRDAGQYRAALEHHRAAIVANERVYRLRPQHVVARKLLADNYIAKAQAQTALGDGAAALADCREALTMFESLSAIDPANAEARHDLWYAHHIIGIVLIEMGDAAGAIESLRRAARIIEGLIAADPTNIENLYNAAGTYGKIGVALGGSGKTSESIENHQRTFDFLKRYLAINLADARVHEGLATCSYIIGEMHARLATMATTPLRARAAHRREACEHYQRSSDVYLALRESNALTKEPADNLDAVAREVARCGAASRP